MLATHLHAIIIAVSPVSASRESMSSVTRTSSCTMDSCPALSAGGAGAVVAFSRELLTPLTEALPSVAPRCTLVPQAIRACVPPRRPLARSDDSGASELFFNHQLFIGRRSRAATTLAPPHRRRKVAGSEGRRRRRWRWRRRVSSSRSSPPLPPLLSISLPATPFPPFSPS